MQTTREALALGPPSRMALLFMVLTVTAIACMPHVLAVPPPTCPNDAADTTYWTTNNGEPVFNNDNSLTVGDRGPILLEDYHLVEKLANFDRERIPERVVHARGTVARGTFYATADISNLTIADFLKNGTETPIIVRFSTVVHERGSPETLRDPRGFAVKFYTQQGNYDLVGNNMPVFFIRDGMKFPDMVHAFKPDPKTHIQEDWRILDFFSHHPESLHMFTFLLDDVGIPKDYRHMPGFGLHTFKLISESGNSTYVKFHWVTKQGIENLLDDEAVMVGGAQHSHATKDLYDAIDAGQFPEWELKIQTMDPETEDQYDFDPLDVTKTWPEDRFPLQTIGHMVLNQNPDNFFNDNEQLAFDPAVVVPGIYYSDDKLLQTRLFSYHDTQRYRVGGNYLLLPVNRPICPYHNNHHDGVMNFKHRESQINYFPSWFDPVQKAKPYPIPTGNINGKRIKHTIGKENNFQQAGERFNSWDADRQQRFIVRFVKMACHPFLTEKIQNIWIDNWSKADAQLGSKIAAGVDACRNKTSQG